MRKAQRIGFHPGRHIVQIAIFPCTEPQQYQMQVVRPRAFQKLVNDRVVEVAFLRFQLLPVNGCLQRVSVQSRQ